MSDKEKGMRSARFFAVALILAAIFAVSVSAQEPSSPSAISLQPFITTGLSAPVFMTSSHDTTGRLFIVQQGGTILVVPAGSQTPNATPFLNITSRVLSGGERGLLGLTFHPKYYENGRFFVYYTCRLDTVTPANCPADGTIKIAEYVNSPPLTSNVASTTEKVIITIPHPTNSNHNGGTVEFGPDGYLYAGPGDGGSGNDPPNNAQNINTLLGKIIRIDIDNPDTANGLNYSSPTTNPFYGAAVAGRDEIFAVGMRNPYRFSFDRGRPRSPRIPAQPFPLWVADVGQGSIEEIDQVTLGGNYGWRAYEGNSCTGLNPQQCVGGSTPITHAPPLLQYTHVNAGNGFRCSVTGGYTYRGRARTLPKGAYIYADYCSGEIFIYDNNPTAAHPILLIDTTVRIVGFAQDDRGELYIVTESGTIQKIVGTFPRSDQTDRDPASTTRSTEKDQ